MAGPAMSEVAKHMATMATKIRSSITPLDKPTPARMMPVAPCAFKPNAMATASRLRGMPARQAPPPAKKSPQERVDAETLGNAARDQNDQGGNPDETHRPTDMPFGPMQ